MIRIENFEYRLEQVLDLILLIVSNNKGLFLLNK